MISWICNFAISLHSPRFFFRENDDMSRKNTVLYFLSYISSTYLCFLFDVGSCGVCEKVALVYN